MTDEPPLTPWEQLQALTHAVLDATENPGPQGSVAQLVAVLPALKGAVESFGVLMEAVEWNVREAVCTEDANEYHFALRALELIEGKKRPVEDRRWR